MTKTKYAFLVGACLALSKGLNAQNALPIQTNDSAGWVLRSIGPNSKIWTTQATNSQNLTVVGQSGGTPPQSRVMEVATGMNYWDGWQWSPSDPTFAASTNGFDASQVQHPVSLSSDLNTVNAVTVTTPDGILLQSTPVAI